MSARCTFLLSILLIFASQPYHIILTSAAAGRWQLLQKSVGISAMHMQLLKNDRVVMFDRTDFGPSNLQLSNGKCRNDPTDTAIKVDCTAHSVEYDVLTNKFRALTVQTNVWCSSGAVTPNGNLVQTGGFNDGELRVRVFTPCGSCDWLETPNGLAASRWYASNHILPDGRQIVVGGRGQFNYEFVPKNKDGNTFKLSFLSKTNERGVENNLYPYVFLNVDGNLFIFANNRAILLDYVNNKVVKTYPKIPGGQPRSYTSTGSAVLLPLKNLTARDIQAEVLVCGGAPKGSFIQALRGEFVKALDTCARISINDRKPQWILETMPMARVMGDMILLPNGNVLLINGAGSGAAGWELGRNPILNPVLYRPNNNIGSRFETQNPTKISRMYHSTAALHRDGRVLVGGSNPHAFYNFTGVLFPTELSLEAFSPGYLNAKFNNFRPTIVAPKSMSTIRYCKKLTVQVIITGRLAKNLVSVTMVSPAFNTHSFSMNQRLLVLDNDKMTALRKSRYNIEVTTPSSGNLAPAGYYLLFVVHQDIPSQGIWVKLQ
ncbi:Glyoxal oxidase-related protein [Hibiscus syriacus]|uniref:Aldehyde oxidase GLOX n=1 Tax=Hibiscus syriacus TaxID=106335 RepID=A0A6A2WL93_HIBSY|nr:aldehyde oxidase GLOX-like [Hibiscus syriacus]KAE8654030.1 Glyoxal oxidase-related protein [Hibiscus syriacus]